MRGERWLVLQAHLSPLTSYLSPLTSRYLSHTQHGGLTGMKDLIERLDDLDHRVSQIRGFL
jgi:hypothetical protein